MTKIILLFFLLIGCSNTTTETIKVEETIPFEETVQDDFDLPLGESLVLEEGQNGLKEITYEVIYQGETEVSRKEISEVIVREPKTQIIASGKMEEIEIFEPTQEQIEHIQAWSQISLGTLGYEDDTSAQPEDWTIETQEFEDYIAWTVTTNSDLYNEVVWVFHWTGEESDDSFLRYLSLNGEEIINKLD